MSTATDRASRSSGTPGNNDGDVRAAQIEGIVENPVHPAPPFLWAQAAALALLVGVGLKYAFDWDWLVSGVLAFIVYLVAVNLLYRFRAGSRHATDQTVKGLVYAAFTLAVIPLISLLWTVVANGYRRGLTWSFLAEDMTQEITARNGTQVKAPYTGLADQQYMLGEGPFVGGIADALWGTLMITGLATLISVPIGVLTAIYLVEYAGKSKLARVIRFLVDVMTGIPSIVAGLFAVALFAVLFGVGTKNGMAGAIALSVLMIPTVVRNSEEMLKIVPNELREASLALGVPKWRTIVKVVLPTAISGLASGVTLAIARVIGETAPILVAVGYNKFTNKNPFNDQPMTTLAQYTYNFFQYPLNGSYADPSIERAWGAALILMLVVVLLNLIARAIAAMFAPKTGR